MRIAVFGAGAVGCSLCGWVAARHPEICIVARGRNADAIEQGGITLYPGHAPRRHRATPVRVVRDLREANGIDAVLLAVKNYSLEPVAQSIRDALDSNTLVVGLQNGVENQEILPRYFTKVIYGIVGYNAWVDKPGVVGFQKRGPLVLGTPYNSLKEDMDGLVTVLGTGVKTVITDRLQDAVHSKLVLNLANSLTTLSGHTYQEPSAPELLQTLLSNVLMEGIEIVRAAGYREWHIGGMPSWRLIRASATLPQWLTRPLFRRNLRKMVRSSMAQDVIGHRRQDTELESINGYLLRLAEKHGVHAPYNRALHEICREEFPKPDFRPLDTIDLWRRMLATF